MMMSAVIYPKQKKVACVLLQAVYGGDRRVPHMFATDLWAVYPEEGAVGFTDTRENWQKLADQWNKEHYEQRRNKRNI